MAIHHRGARLGACIKKKEKKETEEEEEEEEEGKEKLPWNGIAWNGNDCPFSPLNSKSRKFN